MVTIVLSFIRHAESTENSVAIWTGWRESSLSTDGINQSQALASALSTNKRKITHIYTSDLIRGETTARIVYDALPDSKPLFKATWKLRGQNYGDAEGQLFRREHQPEWPTDLEECFKIGIYPVIKDRKLKFPNGESFEDMKNRAEEFLNDEILPLVTGGAIKESTGGSGSDDGENEEVEVLVVTHGMCIHEMMPVLLSWDPENKQDWTFYAPGNTSLIRLRLSPKIGENEVDSSERPRLSVNIFEKNNMEHLNTKN